MFKSLFPTALPCLPHKPDSKQRQKKLEQQKLEQRQKKLERKRKAYPYNHAFLESMAFLNTAHQGLPVAEWFSLDYLVPRLLVTAVLPLNQIWANLRQAIWNRVDELKDYKTFFSLLRQPDLIAAYEKDGFLEDSRFAEQRLSGANPMVLKRLPAEFAFMLPKIQQELGSQKTLLNLQEAFEQGDLYLADYRILSPVQGGRYGGLRQYLPTPIGYGVEGKSTAEPSAGLRQYLPAPLAFFHYERSGPNSGRLMPLAIQIQPEELNSPILTPQSPALAWQYAKLCVQVADANHHELIGHLCYTHLVMEPFGIATARQLSENHPLSVLLKPHFRFMLIHGDLARTRLLGYVDRLLAGTLAESLRVIEAAYGEWSLDQFAFEQEIQNRDMNDLPHYPYRDDGRLVWNAIQEFVSDYLDLYYKTPDDLLEDTELQAWAAELVDQHGGRVKGMPGRIERLEDLKAIITNVIFTCGPQHSALNYAQYEYMAYAPNMPLSSYQPIRADGNIQDENSFLPFLPPRTQTAEQLAILYILAAPYYYDRLGHYKRPFADPEAQKCIQAFQAKLKDVEETIQKYNKSRAVKYPYLNPKQILNSISM